MKSVSDALKSHFGGMGSGSFEDPVFGISPVDPEKDQHPSDGKCKVCDKTLTDGIWRNADQVADYDHNRWLFRGWMPITCCDACLAKTGSATATRGEADWVMRCPTEFKVDWKSGKSDDKAFQRASEFNARLGKGLVFHGQSGAGKTRIMWQLARKVAMDGFSWLWLDSLDYLDALPKEALSVQVLFLDDLGNEPLSPQAETRLLKLIRARCDWHRPIVVSTQHVGESLSKRFKEGAAAQAVIRRLREFCDSVHVKTLSSY